MDILHYIFVAHHSTRPNLCFTVLVQSYFSSVREKIIERIKQLTILDIQFNCFYTYKRICYGIDTKDSLNTVYGSQGNVQ
jgi:hypothetical protein